MNGFGDKGPHALESIALQNLLSFGPESVPIPLMPLNVLIGPNGSGKSNLIDALTLLRSTPGDVRRRIIRGGGTGQWIWKGEPSGTATIEAIVANSPGWQALQHTFGFRAQNQGFVVEHERIAYSQAGRGQTDPFVFYRYHGGKAELTVRDQDLEQRTLPRYAIADDQSILAQRRDPDAYPALATLSDFYASTRVYREWHFGRNAIFRNPQPSDMRADRLEEDFSNLGLILSRLARSPRAKQTLLGRLRDLYAGLDDFDVSVEGGTVQVFLTEGNFSIPATRLSDGALRYLCLLAILLDPAPPKLVCIEEPELGLHPDLIPKVADLLSDASQRMQLIVTTHSDILVDAMTERPDSVLICEKHDGQTYINRLDSEQLSIWLEHYRLGELWTRGEIGGNRW